MLTDLGNSLGVLIESWQMYRYRYRHRNRNGNRCRYRYRYRYRYSIVQYGTVQ